MRCRSIEKHILAFIKNDLPQGIRYEIEDHLKNCPKCTELIHQFSAIWKRVEEPEQIKVSPYFWLRVQERMNERKSWVAVILNFSNRMTHSMRPALATIAIVTGLYLGYLLGNFNQYDYQRVTITQGSESTVEDFFNSSYLTTLRCIPNTSFESVYINMVFEEKEKK